MLPGSKCIGSYNAILDAYHLQLHCSYTAAILDCMPAYLDMMQLHLDIMRTCILDCM